MLMINVISVNANPFLPQYVPDPEPDYKVPDDVLKMYGL